MSKWPLVKLGEYCDALTGFPFKSSEYSTNPNDVRLLRGDNIAQQYLRWDGAKYWSVTKLEPYSKYLLQDGDIVLAMDRPWIEAGLKLSMVKEKDLPALLVQRVTRLRGTHKLETRFLYYTLLDQQFTNYVKNVQTGTGVPHISLNQITSYQIPLPPIEIQRKIANILGSLDDKIELNRRMNETLEQMAMALYKHWFVDFGSFQDGEFVETELGMSIPNGWEICNFGDVSLNFNSRRIPLSNIQRQERKGSYPYYGAAGIIDFVDDYLYDGVFLLVGEDGSVMKDDGTPFLQYVEGKFWVNNHAHVIQGTNDVSTEWLMLHLKSTDISRYVTGAVQPKLSKGNLNSIPFVLPPTEIRKEFNNKIVSFFEQIRSNEKENKYLAETRDYLLPLLLSGEIELTEAQEQVEEVLANA